MGTVSPHRDTTQSTQKSKILVSCTKKKLNSRFHMLFVRNRWNTVCNKNRKLHRQTCNCWPYEFIEDWKHLVHLMESFIIKEIQCLVLGHIQTWKPRISHELCMFMQKKNKKQNPNQKNLDRWKSKKPKTKGRSKFWHQATKLVTIRCHLGQGTSNICTRTGISRTIIDNVNKTFVKGVLDFMFQGLDQYVTVMI